jgi:hypothetical protein
MNHIVEWNNIMLEAVRALGRLPFNNPNRDRGGPPQVARSIAILYTAVYDAWSAYDAVAKPVHRTTPRKPAAQHTEANRRKAISQAAYRALIDQFPPEGFDPEFKARFESMLAALLAKDGITIVQLGSFTGPGPNPKNWSAAEQAIIAALAERGGK